MRCNESSQQNENDTYHNYGINCYTNDTSRPVLCKQMFLFRTKAFLVHSNNMPALFIVGGSGGLITSRNGYFLESIACFVRSPRVSGYSKIA